MKKKIGAFLIAFLVCVGMVGPTMQVQAATGKTTVAVTAGTLNIGDSVTVTAKAFSTSGESAYAVMTLSYDASILEFVSCTATYGGGGGSISATTDNFSVTLKAISAGKASVSLAATDGVIYSSGEELTSMAGSSTSITVNNAASSTGSTTTGNATGTTNGSNTSNGTTGTTNSTTQSADNSLKSLTISPGTLSPSFSGSQTKYTATVSNDVTSIAVSATPVNAKATVESVTGNTSLAVGSNVIQIVVKAENGTTATYKITVTRQAGGESTTTDTPPVITEEPDSEAESETADTGATALVNNVSYRISNGFAEEQIPTDFTETTVNYHGTECRGLSFNKGTISLIYLETDSLEETVGRFFIYDEVRDTLYDFAKMVCGENYVIPLLAPVDYAMPDTYLQSNVTMPDGAVMSVYQKTSEDETAGSSFYLFYGVNQEGTEGWYQYDTEEGTYQRYNGDISEEDDTVVTDNSELQADYAALSEKYKSEKSFSRNVIAGLAFAVAVLLIIIFNIFFIGRKKKDDLDDDDDLDDNDDEYQKHSHIEQLRKEQKPARKIKKETKSIIEELEKESEEEIIKENVKEEAGKKVKKEEVEKTKIPEQAENDKNSIKNEKDLNVLDLNDL